MCWTSIEVPVEKTAELDIPIFKVCKIDNDGNITSYYYDFEYELNKTYAKDTPLEVDYVATFDIFKIHSGFHSYSSKCPIKNTRSGFRISGPTWGTLDTFGSHESVVIVKGFIPKGSKYYENARSAYVSDAIVLTECILQKNIKTDYVLEKF